MQRALWSFGESEPRTAYGDAQVHWSCCSAAHRAAPSRGGRGGLIVHKGKWAYCDGAVFDSEHQWIATGGVPIDQLIDWPKAMDPWRATTVRR